MYGDYFYISYIFILYFKLYFENMCIYFIQSINGWERWDLNAG